MTRRKVAALLVPLAALAAIAVMAAGSASAAGKPIVIGWAFDSKGAMAPFDGPALAAAQIRVKQVNAKGGVKGRPLKIITCDTQGNKPAIAKSCALKLIGQKARHHLHDLRRRLRRTRRAGGDQRRQARDRSVHRHRPDGPEAVRPEGKARVLLRQRGPGRGIGDGAVRVGEGLEDARRSQPTP